MNTWIMRRMGCAGYRSIGRILCIACVVGLLVGLTGCSNTEEQLAAKAISIELDGSAAVCDGAGVQIEDGMVTITQHGIYRLSGTWNRGQVLVDCTDSGEVWLLLDGAEITNSKGACIYVKQADMTHVVLAADSVNRLTDGTSYTFDPGDDEPNGVLFARDDIVLSGEGTLEIDANFKFAIAGKDDLTIEGGSYVIRSVGHGIKGKDNLLITGGNISIEAEGDGLKATNADGGTIRITGGMVDLFAGDEGIQSVGDVVITGGSVTVDSKNNGIRSGTVLAVSGGTVAVNAEDTAVDAPDTKHTGGVLMIDGTEME